MTEPALQYLDCPAPASGGSRRMAWWQRGRAEAPHVVLCGRGLTRQGRDFDTLAQAFQERLPHGLRVIGTGMGGVLGRVLARRGLRARLGTSEWRRPCAPPDRARAGARRDRLPVRRFVTTTA